MKSFLNENLCHDPLHGYIRFTAPPPRSASREPDGTEQLGFPTLGDIEKNTSASLTPKPAASKARAATQLATPRQNEPESSLTHTSVRESFTERQMIDDPWLQRLRQIHQLQTAWWVFPTAEHTRFQHVLGVMHLASQAVQQLYSSLAEVDPNIPSMPVVDSMMRMAALLHDVGHGPFGHFFDEHYLRHFGLTHETLGAQIIRERLADKLMQLRRSPQGNFPPEYSIDPQQIAWLIQRPASSESLSTTAQPIWLWHLRSLFCGLYTVDNMDFVLRDAYMTGFSPRAFDLQRLLHYSFYTASGLTIHERGLPALVHFLSTKAELFRSVYFHRTVRAIDLELAELFVDSRRYILPGNPSEHLDDYLQLTEFSLLTDARRWVKSSDPWLSKLGRRWQLLLDRQIPWIMICQRNITFREGQSEASSIFSSPELVHRCIVDRLPSDIRSTDFRIDIARHIHRPHTQGAAGGQNFLFDSSSGIIRPLTADGLYRHLPISHRICRIYARDRSLANTLTEALDQLIGSSSVDDLTNM